MDRREFTKSMMLVAGGHGMEHGIKNPGKEGEARLLQAYHGGDDFETNNQEKT